MVEDISLGLQDALIVGDIQIDFLPGGALPVKESNQVLPMINDYIRLFEKVSKIFVVRDWHPANHVSFKEQGGPWPSHCVQNSIGAMFHPDLKLPPDVVIISKGTNPNKESYSAFDGTNLNELLRFSKISRVFVCGVATDYCVKHTVLDAIKQGFKSILLSDAIKGIDVSPGDSERAVEQMIASGTNIVTLKDFLEPMANIPSEAVPTDAMEEISLDKARSKKKARLRSRGPYRKAKTER